ncbi:hypothetical protein CEXT_627341 [Caerostris extrusa]|uniref:Uncharacterized protein n=1 Tax=Caerostris extrusa TaxID=172846 RepID=A0AAV4U2V0_CAEEX|nr:hypothetical protein CEXT_627341 [Caerostris extrusa]
MNVSNHPKCIRAVSLFQVLDSRREAVMVKAFQRRIDTQPQHSGTIEYLPLPLSGHVLKIYIIFHPALGQKKARVCERKREKPVSHFPNQRDILGNHTELMNVSNHPKCIRAVTLFQVLDSRREAVMVKAFQRRIDTQPQHSGTIEYLPLPLSGHVLKIYIIFHPALGQSKCAPA